MSKTAIYISSSYEHGRNRKLAAINLPLVEALDLGIEGEIRATWERIKRGTGIEAYVTFSKLCKESGLEIQDVAAQLKSIWLSNRNAIGFQIDRMGANVAFRFN